MSDALAGPPPLAASLPRTADACVIGAGVMGLFTALALRRRGREVVVVDRGWPGCEASAANAGPLAVQNKSLPLVPLVRRAIARWAALSEETGFDIEYERRGGLRLAHSPEDVAALERSVASQRAVGLDVTLLQGRELATFAPYLSPAVRAAGFCPDDGMANPLASTRALLLACRRSGVAVGPQAGVTALRAGATGGFTVVTRAGAIACRDVVAAAGTWLVDLCAMVGVTLRIEPEVLQVAITESGAPLFPHVVSHVRGNLTLKQQRLSGKVMVGGGWKGRGDAATGRKDVDHDNLADNLRWAVAAIPGIAGRRLLRAWAGFEGRTPDKLLVVGPVGAPPGFHVVGCTGGGYTVSPAAGELAAALVDGEPHGADVEPLLVRRLIRHETPVSATTGPP